MIYRMTLYEPTGEPGLGGVSERGRGLPEPDGSVARAGVVRDVGGVEASHVRTPYTSRPSAEIDRGNSAIIQGV